MKESSIANPSPDLSDVHTLLKTDIFVGEGSGKRRKRSECVQCPFNEEPCHLNRENRRVITYCPGCKVALHGDCFVPYHKRIGLDMVKSV